MSAPRSRSVARGSPKRWPRLTRSWRRTMRRSSTEKGSSWTAGSSPSCDDEHRLGLDDFSPRPRIARQPAGRVIGGHGLDHAERQRGYDPRGEDPKGSLAPGHPQVSIEDRFDLLQNLAARALDRDKGVVHTPLDLTIRIVNETPAARHAGAEVSPNGAEHHDGAPRHVLARVIPSALDDRERAAVANGEPLAGSPGAVELTSRRSVESGVAHEHGVARVVVRRANRDPASSHALAHVVVGLALQTQLHPMAQKRSEALARLPPKVDSNASRGRRRSESPSKRAAEARANRSILVRDAVM